VLAVHTSFAFSFAFFTPSCSCRLFFRRVDIDITKESLDEKLLKKSGADFLGFSVSRTFKISAAFSARLPLPIETLIAHPTLHHISH